MESKTIFDLYNKYKKVFPKNTEMAFLITISELESNSEYTSISDTEKRNFFMQEFGNFEISDQKDILKLLPMDYNNLRFLFVQGLKIIKKKLHGDFVFVFKSIIIHKKLSPQMLGNITKNIFEQTEKNQLELTIENQIPIFSVGCP